MATGGWRQATQETVVSAAMILASDVALQHIDGQLKLTTDKTAVKKALKHLAASRPGQLLASVMNKGGLDTTTVASPSLTLESEVVALLQAHGLNTVGNMPVVQAVGEIQGAPRSFDIILGNAERTTLRLSLPQSSQDNPASSTFSAYLQEGIDALRAFLRDTLTSVYTVLVEMGEDVYAILPQRVLDASLIEQLLMGTAVLAGVLVVGDLLIEIFCEPEEPETTVDEEVEDSAAMRKPGKFATIEAPVQHEAVEHPEAGSSGGDVGADDLDTDDSENEDVEEVVDSQTSTEEKYRQALVLLVEKYNVIDSLESQSGEQQELLAANGDEIQNLQSRLLDKDSLLATKDQKIEESKKEITHLNGRAEQRTKTVENLTSRLSRAEREIAALRTTTAGLRTDNNIQDATIRTLRNNLRVQERESSELEKDKVALEGKAQKMDKTIDELDASVAKLGDEVIGLMRTNNDLRNQLDDGTVAFEFKMDDIDQLTIEKGELEDEITRLQEVNEQLTQNQNILEAAAETSQHTIDALASENDKHKAQLDTMEKSVDHLQTASGKKDESIRRLTAENGSLTEEVSQIKVENREALEKSDENDEQLAEKDDEIWRLQTALNKKKTESKAKGKEIAKLVDAMKGLDDANIEFVAGAERASELARELRTELKHVKFDRDQALIDYNRVTKELEQSREEVGVSQKELKKAQEELEEAENALMEIQGLGAQSDDEDDADEDDEDGPDEKDKEDKEDEGEGDGHDDDGPNNGREGSGEEQDKEDEEKRDDHKDEGDIDGDDDGDDHGDDAPDGGAGKMAQGTDDNQAGEPHAAPTNAQEVPQQQPLEADGLSATIRSPSVDPAHLGRAAANDPPASSSTQPPFSPTTPVQFTSGSPVKDGRVFIPIRGRTTASHRAKFLNNPFAGLSLPGLLPKQMPEVDAVTTAANPPAANPPAPETDLAPQKAEKEARQQPLTTDESMEPIPSSPTPSTSGGQAADTETTQHGGAIDEVMKSTPSSPTSSSPKEQAAGNNTEQHGGSTGELSDPKHSSPTPSAPEEQATGSNTAQHGCSTDESTEPTQSSPTPSAPEEQAASNSTAQHGGSTDESTEPTQSSPNVPSTAPSSLRSSSAERPTSAPLSDVASPSQASSNVDLKPRSQSVPARLPGLDSVSPSQVYSNVGLKPRSQSLTATLLAPDTSSPSQDSFNVDLKPRSRSLTAAPLALDTTSTSQYSSSVDLRPRSQSLPSRLPALDAVLPFQDPFNVDLRPRSQSLPARLPASSSASSTKTPDPNVVAAVSAAPHANALRPWPSVSIHPPNTRYPGFPASPEQPTPGMASKLEYLNLINAQSGAQNEEDTSPMSMFLVDSDALLHQNPKDPQPSVQSRDEDNIFDHAATPFFTPWPSALPPFLTSLAKYSAEISYLGNEVEEQDEEQDTSPVEKKKKRRSKPRPKTSHFETGSWKLRNVFAQTRGMEGLFEEDGIPVVVLPSQLSDDDDVVVVVVRG